MDLHYLTSTPSSALPRGTESLGVLMSRAFPLSHLLCSHTLPSSRKYYSSFEGHLRGHFFLISPLWINCSRLWCFQHFTSSSSAQCQFQTPLSVGAARLLALPQKAPRAGLSNSVSPGATSASQLPSKGPNNFRTV